jgi:hypothetical protein
LEPFPEKRNKESKRCKIRKTRFDQAYIERFRMRGGLRRGTVRSLPTEIHNQVIEPMDVDDMIQVRAPIMAPPIVSLLPDGLE